ncbi:MAG: hypothetical protein GXP26_00285 [Planctomycetes bacterium]|nr:hypothetical protein [Planctomycetota bacterium]
MGSISEIFGKNCRSTRTLFFLALFSACGYAALLWLGRQFAGDVPDAEKPTLWMLTIFALEFLCYGAALGLVVRIQPTKMLLCGIVGVACLFRAILLPSVPMHEIDIYRYIWDGAVLADGVNPYRYSPQQVREAVENPAKFQKEDLQKLVALQARNASLAASLKQIHYGELSSPYPLVSQAVFAWAALVTPEKVSLHTRLVVMKLLLVLFDLATLLVVIALLREVKLHPGLSIAYGWCPLVLKEIANGGHLDSIAIFLTTLAIWLLVRSCSDKTDAPIRAATLSGVVLALAIAAKIYPVVLLPLFVAVWWRRCGVGATFSGAIAATIPATILLAPMLTFVAHDRPPTAELVQDSASLPTALPHLDPSAEPPAGLQAFFKRWEMNDLLFMVVLENLGPQADVAPEIKPWFVAVPDAWSRATVLRFASLGSWVQTLFGDEAPPPENLELEEISDLTGDSFLLTRVITGGFLACLACWLAWRAAGVPDPHAWCRAAMLTLAWFWMTCPTQNPWYWCWVLPLLPFAKYRTWYLVAGCSLLYYLRFWLSAHYPDPPVLGTRYNGEYFFYFVVVWIEFAPCLLLLGLEWFLAGRKSSRFSPTNQIVSRM